MYVNGKGVLKDYKQAVYWCQKSADQGYAKAQSNLGIAYTIGKGVLKDYFNASITQRYSMFF
jgi:TPR repeat protein